MAGATGGVAALGFLLTLPLWGETYSVLAGFGPGLFFLASVLVWAVFTLQDVALAGLRQATWVPLNSLSSAWSRWACWSRWPAALPDGGIFVSWIVPTALALIPINWLIFGVVVPRHVTRTDPARSRRGCGRSAGSWPATSPARCRSWRSSTWCPWSIATQVDEATFGRFSMAHTLGCMIELLAMNMAVSLTVEGSFDRSGSPRTAARALRRAFMIIVPIIVVAIVGAPLILPSSVGLRRGGHRCSCA